MALFIFSRRSGTIRLAVVFAATVGRSQQFVTLKLAEEVTSPFDAPTGRMSFNSRAKASSSAPKRAFAWAALATVGACAACCTLPLLVVAGVGGGALAAVVAFIRPGVDLVIGASVGLAVYGLLVLRARSQRPSGPGCGCAPPNRTLYASPKPSADEPIVCTADLTKKSDVQHGLEAYRGAFEHWLRTEHSPNGFRWVFSRAPGLEQRLLGLMKAEHGCCRFFEFELQSTDRELVWITRGSEASESVVEEFARLPARLKEHGTSEAGIGAVKRHAESAGLSFRA